MTKVHFNPNTSKVGFNNITNKVIVTPSCILCPDFETPLKIQVTFSGITLCAGYEGDINVARTVPFFNRGTWCEWSNYYSQNNPIVISGSSYFVYVTLSATGDISIWLYAQGTGERPFLHYRGTPPEDSCVNGIFLNDYTQESECGTLDVTGFKIIAYGGQCEIVGL